MSKLGGDEEIEIADDSLSLILLFCECIDFRKELVVDESFASAVDCGDEPVEYLMLFAFGVGQVGSEHPSEGKVSERNICGGCGYAAVRIESTKGFFDHYLKLAFQDLAVDSS